MAATEATAALNAMASTTPGVVSKKRQRTPEQDEGSPSLVTESVKSKTGRSDYDNTASEPRSSNRLQKQGLRSTEAEADGGDGTYSPGSSEREVPKKYATRPTKRKPSRRLNQKQSNSTRTEASPFSGHAFDSIDPVQNSKAQLTSFNSPAKSTRARSKRGGADPLLVLEDHSILFKSRPQDDTRERSKKAISEQHDTANGHKDSHSTVEKQSVSVFAPKGSQSESDPDQESHSDTENDGPADAADDAVEDRPNGNDHEQISSAAKAQRQDGRKTRSREKSKRKGQRKGEAQQAATEKPENLIEVTRAEEEAFVKRCTKYMEGISDLAKDMNLYETWAAIGGAALTIRHLVLKKKKLDLTRTNSVLEQIFLVTRLYKARNCNPEDGHKDRVSSSKEILKNVQLLRDRAESSFLRQEDQSQEDETSTLKDLYEQLIPSLLWLLRHALQATYERKKGLSKTSNKELLKLTKAGLNFCDIAIEWQPNSSSVESGVRKMVRNFIRPNLSKLYAHFLQNDTRMAQQEWEDRQNRELAARQAESRKLMRKETISTSNSHSTTFIQEQNVQLSDRKRDARTLQELEVHPIRSLPVRQPNTRPETLPRRVLRPLSSPPRKHDQRDLLELEELELGPLKKQHPPERQRRLPTEEIPAPDPSVRWTNKENVALLNGLQEFLNGDRYTRILEKYPQLGGKDMDQIVAQAQFFKRVSERNIQILESQGDHSLSWLSTVTL